MVKCKTCSNSMFSALWGEYKCLKRGHTIYSNPDHCEFYAKTKKDVSIAKDDENTFGYREDEDNGGN